MFHSHASLWGFVRSGAYPRHDNHIHLYSDGGGPWFSAYSTQPYCVATITPVTHYCMDRLEMDENSAVLCAPKKLKPDDSDTLRQRNRIIQVRRDISHGKMAENPQRVGKQPTGISVADEGRRRQSTSSAGTHSLARRHQYGAEGDDEGQGAAGHAREGARRECGAGTPQYL